MKTITEYEIITHGVEWSDYFQGCGTAFTEYTDVATGIGSSEREAAEDALGSLAQNDWDTDSNAELSAEVAELSDRDEISDIVDEYCEDNNMEEPDETPWVYVSIRVRN